MQAMQFRSRFRLEKEACVLHQGRSDSLCESFTWLLHALPGNLRNNKHTCACVHHTHIYCITPPKPPGCGVGKPVFHITLAREVSSSLAPFLSPFTASQGGRNHCRSRDSPGKAISIIEKGLICRTESPLRRRRETRDRRDPIGLSECLKERLR